ncbi:acyltransferase [Raoultella lignicola]|uniref:Acyltransferase n=1 Tax=Raoultella lignicola TaxID=3040939 RepID=A0ABU9FBG9_9ENTR
MSQNKHWSPELDGLRGYASLWVLLGHICILTQCNIPVISNPDLGVDLFILLSGYLMAKNYIERRHAEPWASSKTIVTFWVRRFFRIAPLYYILLIVAFAFGEIFGHYRDVIATAWPVTQTETSRYTDSSFINVITHISFTFGFLPYYSFRTVLPDWSIGLEMQYYFLFPFIMLLISALGFKRISIALIVLCAVAAYVAPEYFSKFPMPSMILFKLPLFISGMLIYRAVSENKTVYVLVAMLAPFAALATGYFSSPIRMVIEELLILGMATLLIQHSSKSKLKGLVTFAKKLLSIRVSQFLGDVSYSVYLLHLMIVIPVTGLLIQHTGFENLASLYRFFIVTLIVLPTTYIAASLLYKFVEKKGISLGRKIIKPANKKEKELA